MNVDELPVQDIIPYGQNPRKNEEAVDVVAKSIEQFGFQQPLVLDKDRTIVVGHTRFKAALKLGFKTIPCIIADNLSDEQINAYRIMDNKSSEYAFWHEGLLLQEMTKLLEQDYDLEFTGFTDVELKELGLNVDLGFVDEGFAHEDDVPDVPDEPVTKPGDIWLLGNHRLVCGDITQANMLSELCGLEKADLLLTDPPYNVSYVGKTKDHLTIQNDAMSDSEFRGFLTSAFEAADSNMKEGASFYIWHADVEGYNFRGACKDVNWPLRQTLIWHKNSIVMGRQDYHWRHEPCLYGWKTGEAHHWYADRKQQTILEFRRPQKSELHPTMKPVDLLAYLLQNSTKIGDLVLDTFLGSGSTLIACEKTGRTCYGVELDPKYCDVIVKRWENFTNQTAKLQILTENGERIRKING
jgi:DNA modification methylase